MRPTVYHRMAALRAAGQRFAVATVVRTQGSTPQVVGATLVLGAQDEIRQAVGTLGGGCVEADAVDTARLVITTGESSLRAYELNEELAWNTGLVCGGTMWILVQRDDIALTCGGIDVLPHLVAAADGSAPAVLITRLRRSRERYECAGRMALLGDRAHGTLGHPDLDHAALEAAAVQGPHGTARLMKQDDNHDLLLEAVASRPRVVVAGGGHVALAIARQAHALEFDVTILEDRPEFAATDRFPGATVLEGDVPTLISQLQYTWNTFIVIATRGHKLDADCVLQAARTHARYIGLLGSRRKTVLIEAMLREEGIPEGRFDAIRAPVGLDLGGRTPAEIALSVMAEITQVRYQGTARPLSERR